MQPHALLSGEAKTALENCAASKVILLDSVPIAKEKRIKNGDCVVGAAFESNYLSCTKKSL